MKVNAIIQARLTSTRLPNKVLMPIENLTIIKVLYKRLSQSKFINKIIFAIPDNKKNKELKKYFLENQIDHFCGDEDDVLDRYYKTALNFKSEIIIRITGDCPLVDHSLVDRMISRFKSLNVDYLSNVNPPTYPDGMDVEIFTFDCLEKTWDQAVNKFDREHVTPYMKSSKKFNKYNFTCIKKIPKIRLTIDEKDDYIVIKKIFKYFDPNIYFSLDDILDLYKKNKTIFEQNLKLERNEGLKMSNGQKLWKRAKNIIPGGNMLLSKRPEMFLPKKWPTYFSKTLGCNIWDLDNKKYIDFSLMGVGTNILGYSNKVIDQAVKDAVSNGNMSTLNSPEEVYLAEKLIDLHPWLDMVRFARTGGEANSIAIRIGRAASGKDKVAICGYHGWHDWYISANLGERKNLDGHLLPGLQPKGVPRGLKGTSIPFKYGDYKKLEEITSLHDIGVIKMEVCRSEAPNIDFLLKVRDLANKKNIVLIFDECTSGFRESLGGLHKKINVKPDMTILGKALGNGYAITAVLGKREIMEFAQDTFISSTFWTERIGPVAAKATINEMDKIKAWEIITNKGINIIKNWRKLARKYDINIKITGIPSLCGFYIESENWLKYKTFISQEMLNKGILASNTVYSSVAHNDNSTNIYFECLDEIFKIISDCENDFKKIDFLLKNEICHSGFKRLN